MTQNNQHHPMAANAQIGAKQGAISDVHGQTNTNRTDGAVFKKILNTTGTVINAAAPMLSGSAVLSAAIQRLNNVNTGVSSLANLSTTGSGFGNTIGLGMPGGAAGGQFGGLGGGFGGGLGGGIAAGPGPGGLNGGSSLANMQAQSMYFLNLQMALQQENRQYSALSNIMKIEHDTSKASIQNIRA